MIHCPVKTKCSTVTFVRRVDEANQKKRELSVNRAGEEEGGRRLISLLLPSRCGSTIREVFIMLHD